MGSLRRRAALAIAFSAFTLACNGILGISEQTFTPEDGGTDATVINQVDSGDGSVDATSDGSADATLGDAAEDAPPPEDAPLADVDSDAGDGSIDSSVDGGSSLGVACMGDGGGGCASGFCIDGVCCENACAGQCEACNLPDAGGSCQQVAGPPVGVRPPCAGAGTTCEGTCVAGNTLGCTYPGSSTSCRAQSCTGGTVTEAAGCNGSGACPSATTVTCSNPDACSADGGSCANACTSDTECSGSTPYCNSGSCLATKENGLACTAASQCTSDLCVDGYCCNSSCTNDCQACNVAGSLGACVQIPAATQPHGSRAACTGADAGVCGGSCQTTSATACTYPTVTCSAQSCSGSTLTLAASCSNGTCPAAATEACSGGYDCASSTACLTTCTEDSECSTLTPYCNGGSCLSTKEPGLACTANGQCTSDFCVDGYCCNSTCTSDCEACDVPGSLGKCSQVPNGEQPRGSRAACAGADAGVCGGACEAASATACTYPTSSCRAQSCASSTLTLAASCSNGACPSIETEACPGGYECASGGSACLNSCGSDSSCVAADYCAADEQCSSQKSQGQACNTAAGADCEQVGCRECGTAGGCENGYCCNATCGTCQACNVAGHLGTCTTVANGASCGLGEVCNGGACVACAVSFSGTTYTPSASSQVDSVVAGAFRKSSVLDVANTDRVGNVRALENLDAGVFAVVPSAFPASTSGTAGIVSADFNGDGKPDLAVADEGSSVDVLLNTTTGGTLSLSASKYPLGGQIVYRLATGDLNGDGLPDLVTGGSNGSVLVLLNSGDGGAFGSPITDNVVSGSQFYGFATADFNGNGRIDVAAADQGNGLVDVYYNNGVSWAGSGGGDVGGCTSPMEIAAADFNADGRPDLAVACGGSSSTSSVDIFLNTTPDGGNGSFATTPVSKTVSGGAWGIAVGDFNVDGKPDIVVTNPLAGAVTVLLNTGSGTFSTQTPVTVGADPQSVSVGDFNGDGLPDLAVGNNNNGTSPGTVTILLNSCL